MELLTNNNMAIDSREVAEMLSKEHKQLMREIRETSEILTSEKFSPVKYFVESTYNDTKGEERKCYLVTKMGCELLGNKLQGAKGILFTAKYVERFNKMEESLTQPKSALDMFKLELKVLEEHDQKLKTIEQDITDIKENSPLYNIECKELQELVRKMGTKSLGGYKTPAYNNNSLRGKVYSDIQHQLKREFGVNKYEAIKRCQIIKAKEIVQEYNPPTILVDQIRMLNNQVQLDGRLV